MTEAPLPPATATGLHAQADLPIGTLVAGRFRIQAILGIGGMGVVYRAIDQSLDVPVALKLLRPELAARADAFERFRQELLLARQVSSPHVVRIHDLAQHEGRWLISMDFVDGESLDRRLDREGPFAVDDALRIARDIAQGLAAAHDKGVVHRDLKPANILLDAQGAAFISDFGVARSLATPGMTVTGAVVGTPEYLSPEQARGAAVDARSDLYALGLVLYEMLVGKPPFAGGTVAESLAQPCCAHRAGVAPAPRVRPGSCGWSTTVASATGASVPRCACVSGGDRPPRSRARLPAHPRVWLAVAALVRWSGSLRWWWSQQRAVSAVEVAQSKPCGACCVASGGVAADPGWRAVGGCGRAPAGCLVGSAGLAVVDRPRTWRPCAVGAASATWRPWRASAPRSACFACRCLRRPRLADRGALHAGKWTGAADRRTGLS